MDEIVALAEEIEASTKEEAVKRLAQWTRAVALQLEELREFLDRDDITTKGLLRIVDNLLTTATP